MKDLFWVLSSILGTEETKVQKHDPCAPAARSPWQVLFIENPQTHELGAQVCDWGGGLFFFFWAHSLHYCSEGCMTTSKIGFSKPAKNLHCL